MRTRKPSRRVRSQKRSLFGSPQSRSLFQRRALFETLEDRRVLATLYVDDTFIITTDNGDPGLDAGDIVTFSPGAGSQHADAPNLVFGTDAFTSIQAAVNAAAPNDTIRIGSGTFSELVNINKPLTLLGNQTGVDAQDGRPFAPETIVNGALSGGLRTTALWVTASNVAIDGFTVTGQTHVNQFGAGIFLNPGTAGSQIRNNIISFNVVGLFLSNNNGANPTVIEGNVFVSNNNPGAASGNGIYTDEFVAGGTVDGVEITNNTFLNNNTSGINFASSNPAQPVTNATISENTFTGNANGVVLTNTTNSTITQNTFSGSTNSQIQIRGGVDGLQITENFIHDGANRGIWIRNLSGTNQNISINNNSIQGNAGAGLELVAGGYTGTLNAAFNWWGAASGPTSPLNPPGTGEEIVDPNTQVNFSPFLASGVDTEPGVPGFQGNQLGPVGIAAFGTSGDDVFIVTASSVDDGTFQMITNGVPGPVVPFADIVSLSFAGLGGNDTLRIINPAGGLFMPAAGIFYDGGGQAGDTLENLGGAATSGSYVPGPTNDAGVVTHVGAVTQVIQFWGLAPVIDTVAEATFTIDANNNPNAITIDNGVANGDGRLRVSIDAFEPVEFANKTSVVVNAFDGDDTIIVDFTEVATGLATITVNAGVGADVVNVRATAAGVATTINGGDGNDTFNVGSTTNSLDAVLGVVNLNGDGGTNVLNLNDQGDASANTYEITSTQVQRTAAGPAVTVNYGTIQSVNLNAGNQADVINVRSTASGVTYLLNAGGGNDTINFGSAGNSLDGILGAVTVNGGAGTDTINVNDQGDADNNTYAINGSSVNRNGGLVEITYSNVENLFVNAGSGNDTFNVTAAPAGGATIHVDGGPPTTPPGDVLNYSGTGTVTPTGVRAGTISRAGSQDVLFSDIEELTGGPFNVVAPGDINVSQDKAFPSIITVATATGQVAFDATSLLTLSPGSGVVNLIGDNNNTTPQTDNFVVRGTGVGAFSLVLNGSPPVQFGGVSFLNVHGGEEIDTLDISAYADNTAQGWGIQVFFDEGPPAGIDGDQADLLIYNTVAANPVSETIVIQPSGPEDGELRVTNAADGSLIVVISYVNNLDIIVNDNDGFASDTDTLTLRGTNPDNPGTSGDELFIVNLEAAGTVADPMVTVDDAGAAVTLYRVRSISGFDTLNIEALGGSDAVQIDAGASDGSVTLNVDLGLPAGSDVLRVVGTADAGDQFAVFPGSSSDAGRIDVQRSTASAATVINFSGAGSLEIDGGGGTGADSLVLHGTGASDVFTLTGTATSAGTAQAGAGPVVSFSALGSAGTSISLLGQGGDDAFHVSHTSDWQIATVNLSGGTGNNSVQIAGTGGDDAFVYTPASASSGQIALTSGGSTTNYAISGTSSLAIDGLGQAVADSLTTATDNATVVPGGTPGSGTVQPVDSIGAALLSLSYSNIEDVSVSGTTVVVQGTAEDDTIEVLASGVVRVTNAFGFFNETDLSGFANLVISALGGDDTITIAGDHPFASITLSGGEQGASDTLNFVGSGGDVTVNLGTETVQEAGFGPVSFSGIEVLNVSAAGGEIVVLGSSGGDAISVTPTGSDTATIVRAGQNLTVHTDSTGALTINALDGADSVTVHGTAGADTIHVDRGPTTQIEVVGLKLVSVVAASAESLVIAAGLGGDTINVFGSGGPANLLVDAGGAASDTLNVFNTSPGTTTVTPGNTPDSGVIATPDGNVAFAGVGFVSASGAGAGDTIVLLGTHDDDTIALQFLNAANRVWINDRAVVLFDSFEIVTLNGRFGSDTFSVHPVGLVGVTTINVIGGDPTASDSVVITGTAGNDSVNFAPTAADAMTVSGLGPVVNVSSTEHVVYNGLGGADSLTFTTPVGTHIVTLTPGGGPESGTLEVLGTAGANVLLGLSFVQAGANGLLTLADASGARADVFVLRGTDVDDRFNVEASGEVQIRESTNVVWKTKRIQTPGVAFLSLEGLDGDDAFFIAGNHPFLLVQANGGNPGASDVVNFVGSGGDVTIDLAAQTVGEAGFAPVSLSGIETLNVDAGAGSVVILGTADADDLAVTPTGADTATVVAAGFGATINTTSGSLTIDLGGGSDQLTVHGTSSGETIDVSGSAVAVGALQVVAYVGVENLRVLGHAGDDTFNVTPSTTTTYFLDGGDPIGATPGDRIVLDAGGAVVTFEPGPQNDEGGFVVAGHQRISFDHIEGVTVDGGGGGGGAIVNGTNGADSITVIARDGSTHAGADGVQDFTVTVNDGLEILFLDTPSLTINALGGSDEIAVQAPAPNGAVWNVALTIDGGLPTASDTVILGTPGTDTIIYTPSGSDSGTLEIVNLASVINLIQIEHLVYDGEAGDDSLTVVGTPADNTIVHTAGAANDEGALRVDSLLAIAYVNLGAGGVLVVDGNGGIDTLIIDGTAANDAFAVNAAGDVNLNSRLTIETTSVENLVLRGLAGSDTFAVAGDHPFASVAIQGGNGAASDSLTFVGSGGTVVVDLAAQTVLETGFGIVSLSGIETLHVQAGAGDLFVLGTGGADALSITPTGADSATVARAGQSLVLHTTNTGLLSIDPLGGNDSVTVHGTAGSDSLLVTQDGADTVVAVGGSKSVNLVSANVQLLVLATGGGDDLVTINVDAAAGSDVIPIPLVYQGGSGSDALVVVGSPATTVDEVIYQAGPTADRGRLTYEDAANVRLMSIEFSGLEPVYDYVPANLTVLGNHANNVITYSEGPNSNVVSPVNPDGALTGLISIDAFETIEFGNKLDLTIDGRAGQDTVAVVDGGNPGASGELTIVGNDPLLSNEVILSGTTGADVVNIEITGPHSAIVTINGTVTNVNTSAKLVYNGLGGNDEVTIQGIVAGDNRFVFVPGGVPDAGSLTGIDTASNVPLLPVEFVQLGVEGTLIIDGNSGMENNTLVVLGTSGHDAVSVAAISGDIALTTPAGGTHVLIVTTQINHLVLEMLEGNDLISVASPLPYDSLTVHGGDPGTGADVLNFTSSGGAVTVNLGAQTVVEAGFGPLSYSGIERINLDAGGVSPTVVATDDDDDVTVTVFSASSGTVQIGSTAQQGGQAQQPPAAPLVHYTNTGGNPIHLDLGGGEDTLIVVGNALPQTITVDGPSSTVEIDDNGDGVNNGIVTYENVESLAVYGLEGSDTFIVTGGPIPIFIDGGDPIGAVGDTLIVTNAVAFFAGPEVDEGGFITSGEIVSFDHIELIIIQPPEDDDCPFVIFGTNADDDITVIARDASYNPLADGVQDFTVSINNGPAILFIDVPVLVIDALAGDDDIVIRGPAPNGAAWDMNITVIGGPASSVTGDQGDVLAIETPGAVDVVYTPTGSDTGTLVITNAGGLVANITIQSDAFVMPPDCPELPLVGGNGGIETLIYDGEGLTGSFTVVGTDGDDVITHRPGDGADEGTLRVNTLLAINYQNLGLLATLAVDGGDGTDTLVVDGTAADDTFSVDAAGNVTLAGRLAITRVDFERLTLRGLDGGDLFQIDGAAAFDAIRIEGGNLSASDVLNFTSSGGAVTIDLGAQTVVEAGFGPLSYSGIERINLDAGGVSPTVVATDDDDDVTVTVFSASSGTVQIGSTAQQGGQAQQPLTAPLVHYTNTGGNPIHLDLGGGEDTLIVVGNALPQTFVVDGPNSRVEIDDNGDGVNNGIVTYENVESLAVYGLEGSDTFIVTGGPIPIFIDGGDPIGAVGDTLIVTNAVAFFAGPEVDEGGFITSGEIVSFDHIELIIIQPPVEPEDDCPFVIFGTNADDDITVIARDASYHPLADGVQDFTVSINAGPAILFIDVPVLVIDALAGDDDIVIRGPAPNGAAWDMNITVIGGPASSVTGDQGDVLAVETPGAVDVVYTPTGSDTGLLVITNANGLVANITIQSDAFVMPPDCPELPLVGGNGGIETLIYDGEGLTGSFTIVGTDGDDTIVHTPGAGIDEGAIRVNTLLGISYQNLGSAASLTVDGGDGADTLVVLGTDLGDTFNVAATTGNVVLSNSLGTRLAIATLGVESLTLDGLEGDDTFIINAPQPYSTISALGGGPGASDVLIVNGAAGIDEAFVVTPAFANGNGSVAVNALLIPYVGIEHVLLDANEGDADTLVVNDDLADNLWTVKAGPIFGDRIQIDSRESIDYTGFTDVTLNNIFGTDRFVIHPTSLVGYSGAFTVNANLVGLADDVLELIGTEAADTVTSTATAITVNGRTITVGNVGAGFAQVKVSTLGGNDLVTLGLALPTVNLVVDGGAGDDTINLSGTTAAASVTIYGGDGDDHITGSPLDDLIYGGAGNDIIIGGPGADRMFGEAGSDTFIWNPGDGSDIIEGGSDESDVLVFNGSAGDEIFTLNAVGTRLQLLRNIGNITMDVAGVEEVRLNMLGGNDSVTVNDLFQTDVRFVAIDVGTGSDAVTVNGREVSDQVNISNVDGVAVITGLRYDVHVAGVVLANNDSLTFNGLGGNDTIVANDNLSALYAVNNVLITGGDGDDFISGYGELRGDAGNDTLVGGAFGQIIRGGAGDDLIFGGGGSDQLFGDDGDDTFVLGFHGAPDIVDGGAGFNTILIQATGANERIDVQQDSPTQLRYEVSGINGGDGILGGAGTETHTLVQATIQNVLIRAGSGDDIIRVAHADGLIAAGNPANAVRFTVEGGLGNDRLTVSDLGPGDTTIHRIGSEPGSGSFQMYAFQGGVLGNPVIGMSPTVYTGIEFASLNPLDPITGGTGADGNGRLFVFKPDPYESNDSLPNATFLGSGTSINVDPTIDPGADLGFNLPGDEDWYRIVAQFTGDIDIRVFFRQQGTLLNGRAGLPGDGNLDIALYDASGDLIAGTGVFGNNDANDDERIRIPAVEGQTYYLRVRGAPLVGDSPAINVYNVQVLNTPAPVPFDLELDDRIFTSTVQAGSTATSVIGSAALPPIDFTGKDLYFTSGPLNGQRGRVVSYVIATRTFNFAPNTFTGAPLAGNTFQVESVDTGRSQFDNITRDNTPTIFLRVADAALLNDIPDNGAAPGGPPDEIIVIPFVSSTLINAPAPGFRVAVFVTENNTHVPVGFAQPVPGSPGLYEFTFTTPLPDGSHFISARVEMIDPALPEQAQGFGAFAQSLEIIVDTQPPPVFFGLPNVPGDGLLPDSDTGVNPNQSTLSDRVTSNTTPGFFGQAEANAVIRLFADVNGNGIFEPSIDRQIGMTVALPFDGTNQYPTGYWQIDAINLNLNDPIFGPIDGLRRIFVTAEDVAGNINAAPFAAGVNVIEIFIDTQGPQITDVEINNVGNPYQLFDPKPSTDGPTPLVNSIWISIQDLPARTAGFLIDAFKADIASNPGHYRLVGDHNGIIPILDVNVVLNPPVAGQPATGHVQLVFRDPGPDGVFNTADDIGAALPDDRFTLFVSEDGIIDYAGNRLDGESNAAEPHQQGGPTPILGVDGVPTGDGLPGGDFVARFTVDSRPEVGVWGAGSVWIDTNGNGRWDPDNPDFTNRDITYMLGLASDHIFAGKFVATGAPNDGNARFDKLGAYGRYNGQFRWLIDTDNDGVPDVEVVDPRQINGIPVAGNFALGHPGEEVGLFTGTTWWFDTNHDWMVDTSLAFAQPGHPIVGDFDGDGLPDLAVFRDDTFFFDLSSVGSPTGPLPGNPRINGTIDRTFKFGFIGPGEIPVAADMNMDGIDDIGLWVPNRDGVAPSEGAEWYFLISGVVGNDTPPGTPPLHGPSITGGNYPIAADGPGEYLQPGLYGLTTYANGRIVADPLAPGQQIVRFNPTPFGHDEYVQFGNKFALPIVGNFDPPVSQGTTTPASNTNPNNPLDVNNDGLVSPLDALLVINHLNREGTGPAPTPSPFTAGPYLDVNSDGLITPLDALLIINYLNNPASGGQGEGEASDDFFSDLGSQQEDDDDLLAVLAADAAEQKKK